MIRLSQAGEGQLACCHGYSVAAGTCLVGIVETPVFAKAELEPDHLIVRTSESFTGTFRVVAAALVADVDLERRCVTLAVTSEELAALPELLPLALR